MCSDLAFGERNSTTAPALDILIGMRCRPFGEFGLRPHQALHWRHVGEYKAAFTALVGCRGKARNKQEFNHGSVFLFICFFWPSRSCNDLRPKLVNSPLSEHPHAAKPRFRPDYRHKTHAAPNYCARAA